MTITTKLAKAVITTGIFCGLTMSSAMAATELKLAHFISPQHHLHQNIFAPLAKDVEEASNGELKIRIYPAGQLGSGPVEQYRRVVSGIADIVHGLPGYTSSQFPRTLLIELPGVPKSASLATKGLWNAMPMLEEEYRRVKLLTLFASGEAMLMLRDKEVRSPKDLQGLKIRAPSSNVAKTLEAWGATPVSMPISEVYNAAQTGVIDGALLDGSTVNSFKLHEVFQHYTIGVPPTTSAIFLIMNRKSWDGLSKEHKAIVDKFTGFELSQKSHQSYADQHEKGLRTLRDQGKNIINLTDEETAAFAKLSSDVVDETVKQLERQGVKNARKIVEAMGLR